MMRYIARSAAMPSKILDMNAKTTTMIARTRTSGAINNLNPFLPRSYELTTCRCITEYLKRYPKKHLQAFPSPYKDFEGVSAASNAAFAESNSAPQTNC
jgi:hypothetical protein